MDAISTLDAKVMGTPEFDPIYDAMQRLESFHTMAHDKDVAPGSPRACSVSRECPSQAFGRA